MSGRLLDRAPRLEALTVGFANLLPLVGVVALGWNVAALVVLYWLELGVLCLWALVRATFAGRPSEFQNDPLILGALGRKRAAIPVPFTNVGVQLSTLPVLVVAVPMLAVVWLFAGVMTVGFVGADSLGEDVFVTVVVAVVGIFVSEGVRTALEYFYRGGYHEHSAQTAIQGPFMRAIAIGLGGVLAVVLAALVDDSVATDEPIGAVDPAAVGGVLLVGVVLVKFAFDLASVYRGRLEAFDESQHLELGWAYEPPAPDAVDTSLSAEAVRLRPTVRGRLLGGVVTLRRHPGGVFAGVFLLFVAGLFAIGGGWIVAVVLGVAAVVVPLALGQTDYWLRYGGVEYRTDGDAIVAYDRLFRTPLWRVEPWDETDLRVECDRADDWLGTSTVVVELRDRTLRLPHLGEPDPILDTFDRRPDRSQGNNTC
ncbi:DUF6498-containing protein [Halorubrum gandharaense]